ncbi:hypothetical protein FHS82_002044 [Pseudochelatococcus lubricantis]|uniref:Twin-arginine translocation pathway signal protein n=1 Tax=Pseudochelatococcus lubricantis TaxID=1538102 RepID=A0ABX0UZ21_9HYPH|nr:hypothetical protein [Pseudochelatococcus lubricantis]NIJ58202.1 hypothetical protein [Pseudochelatococcus lubricantis]
MNVLSRRAFVMTGGAAVAAALGGCAESRDVPLSAADGAALRLRSVTVDTAPLRALGLTPWANLVQASMQPELDRLFAGRLVPRDKGADRLVARVDSVSLSSWSGGGGGGRWYSGGGDSDYMDGYAVVIGPDGRERARYHILLALPSSFSGAWYLPDIDNRRIIGLSRTFARWVRDRVPGR